MNAFIFPGQASQFVGMGKALYDKFSHAKERFHESNQLLGFDITEIMFFGTSEDLKQTKVTQPAVFLHSVITYECKKGVSTPNSVAGHSLGEFSALVVNNTLSFKDGLLLVMARAQAMQKACELNPSTMAAVVGLDDNSVEEICASTDGIVIAANYNCPGQLVISGEHSAVDQAIAVCKEQGARMAIPLAVGGAFHSPLMVPAQEELQIAIEQTVFQKPICPVYQNVDGKPQTDPDLIKQNLIKQLTSPVRWTDTIEEMTKDGVDSFIEVGGTGKVLQGMIKRINRKLSTTAL